MIKKHFILGALTLVLTGVSGAFAKEDVSPAGQRSKEQMMALKGRIQKMNAGCNPATARTNLDINNVRTAILGGGDMWWDLSNASYEVPKIPAGSSTPRKHSLFAGSVWIGGIDAGKTLKVAAQTYRQSTVLGVGFWPGNLDPATATVDPATCLKYDRHWKLTKSQVDAHKAAFAGGTTPAAGYTPPATFLDWPAFDDNGNKLAPFVDIDGDAKYNPMKGDYPQIRGDQSIWFVYNDRGNTAGSGSTPIGMEVQTEAFAYASNDELNNMTFYQHTITNRSTIRLDSCFMAQWVDPDLGNAADDYVGCDVPRGLGICYNGDNDDDGVQGYGLNPPSVGVDFFEGPFSDPFNGVDDDRDCIVDEIDTFACDGIAKTERMIMSKYLYFNNDGTPIGNPERFTQAYNYMTGFWKDGVRMVYGGNGYPGSAGSTTVPAEMMFPGSSDMTYGWSIGGNCQRPTVPPNAWDEVSAGNSPGDRRFVQAGGPFTLKPGAVNFITIGVVWARASSGGATGSFNLLLQADSKAQALFDNCFKILNGPDAPNVGVVELDQKIVLQLSNPVSSNNFKLGYKEIDPVLKSVTVDNTFSFQGYQVYQLANQSVSTGELEDLSKARLIYQCDIKDSIGRVINYYRDPALGVDIPKMMVDGANAGIQSSIEITKDAFATTGDRLVNHRPYYYMVIAYCYNNYAPYNAVLGTGQSKPYFAGRGNIKTTVAIPHKTSPEYGGMKLNSTYGYQPEITRLEGMGNGGNDLMLTQASVDEILANNSANTITYAVNHGPVGLKVVDPKSVPTGNMTMSLFTNTPTSGSAITNNSRWMIEYNGQVINSFFNIGTPNEQLLEDYIIQGTDTVGTRSLGLSVLVKNTSIPPGATSGAVEDVNPIITSSIDQGGDRWLNFIADNDNPNGNTNWILSGASPGDLTGDKNQYYEGVAGGTWAPYKFVGNSGFFPAWAGTQGNVARSTNSTSTVHSIDVVFTSDKSKWTRAVVLEMGDNSANNVGGQVKNQIRAQNSVDKDGNVISTDLGRGWFPGYAIDMETGQRLNICFGENSADAANNGADMLWNPTATRIDRNSGTVSFGGRHFIYVMKTTYDEGAALQTLIKSTDPISPNVLDVRNFYRQVMWVSMPIAAEGFPLLRTKATVKIRHNVTYDTYNTGGTSVNNWNPKYQINLNSIAPVKNDATIAKNSLDTIQVVPNPYYAYSEYENSQIDSRIKITNLPQKCEIKIYTLGGTLVRTLRKDDATTYVEWDLKNQLKIPIASGAYIIHVDAGTIGTKTLKWFCVMRPIDLDTF